MAAQLQPDASGAAEDQINTSMSEGDLLGFGQVERHQPPLVLSGHIHESPRVSSSFRDTIGGTAVVNPGQFGTSRLCGAWFDPGSPGDTLRHTVYP